MSVVKNEMPKVSIITPVFNGADFLPQAIESVLAQDYPNIEYIVLDDGSTDKTQEILKKYSHQLKWQSHPNMGQSRTLNKGWEMSQGEILGYLSADDVLFPRAVSQLVHELMVDESNMVVFPDCDVIDPYNRVIKKAVCKPFDYDDLVIKQECYIGPGALFRKKAWEQMGGWNSELKMAPDREFWMRVGLLGKIVMYPKTLAYYRMHTKSTSYFQSDFQSAEEYIKVMDSYFERDDIPSRIRNQKKIAYGNAYLMSSRLHLRGGRFNCCFQRLKLAMKANPDIHVFAALLMLSRTTLSRVMHKIIWNIRNLASLSPKSTLQNINE